jgi:hypothetical protein
MKGSLQNEYEIIGWLTGFRCDIANCRHSAGNFVA